MSKLPGLVFGVCEIYSGKGNGNEDRETWNERKKNENKNIIMRMKCRSDCPENTDRYIGPCT